MRTTFIAVALLLASSPALFAADDTLDARGVIQGQANALARDDGAGAYSYAAPLVHQVFPDSDTFLAMVRKGYAPIYRHKSFEFGEGAKTDGKIVQTVHIIDADGVRWDAVYSLERGTDGDLKITGCVLLKSDQEV